MNFNFTIYSPAQVQSLPQEEYEEYIRLLEATQLSLTCGKTDEKISSAVRKSKGGKTLCSWMECHKRIGMDMGTDSCSVCKNRFCAKHGPIEEHKCTDRKSVRQFKRVQALLKDAKDVKALKQSSPSRERAFGNMSW